MENTQTREGEAKASPVKHPIPPQIIAVMRKMLLEVKPDSGKALMLRGAVRTLGATYLSSLLRQDNVTDLLSRINWYTLPYRPDSSTCIALSYAERQARHRISFAAMLVIKEGWQVDVYRCVILDELRVALAEEDAETRLLDAVLGDDDDDDDESEGGTQ